MSTSNIQIDSFLSQLRLMLSRDLPGVKAHDKMASTLKNYSSNFNHKGYSPIISAVGIFLFVENKEIHSVLIKRSEYKGYHSGQIGLPGGKMEKDDKDILYTALREAKEEIGIDINKIDNIGRLSDIYIPLSNIKVSPFVFYYKKQTPNFTIDPHEVVHLIKFPVKLLLDAKNIKREKMNYFGYNIDVPYFDIYNYHVWGATAMILSEFVEVLKCITPELH
ncbi:MAG: CoA pyrophosphatase [Marinilabiliales bacterium]